jgi:hypothetical protein
LRMWLCEIQLIAQFDKIEGSGMNLGR